MKPVLSYASTNSISLTELIFMNRNKDYGAYTLRNSYKRNLTIALLICIFIFSASISFPLFLKESFTDKLGPKINTAGSVPIDLQNPGDIKDENEIAKLNETLTKSFDVKTIQFMVPRVVPEETFIEEISFPTIDEIKGKVISTETRDGNNTAENLLPGENETEYQPIKTNETIQEQEAFIFVEEMPSYPGGTDELLSFISNNIMYPEIARRAGVEGKVYISFVVETDGSITNMNIVKGIGAGCNEEAIKVIKLAGNWMPGRQNGKAVRVRMTIPFSFRLN